MTTVMNMVSPDYTIECVDVQEESNCNRVKRACNMYSQYLLTLLFFLMLVCSVATTVLSGYVYKRGEEITDSMSGMIFYNRELNDYVNFYTVKAGRSLLEELKVMDLVNIYLSSFNTLAFVFLFVLDRIYKNG